MPFVTAGSQRNAYDVIVVGSGAAGGQCAYALSMEGAKVLDIRQYPQITYESTSITFRNRSTNLLELVAAGRLTIRGTTQAVTVPVRVQLADASLTATGRFTIKQSAFGITPISVGGVVAVKDTLDIDFTIVARK